LCVRTGASGYIGGQVLAGLVRSEANFTISALLRDQDKANIVARAFPNVNLVLGDLDDVDIIDREASKADIVLRKMPSLPLFFSHSFSLFEGRRAVLK